MRSNKQGALVHARQHYLEHIGLKQDPFIIPVAEQEFAFAGMQDQTDGDLSPSHELFSLSYFVQPYNTFNPKELFLSTLRQKTPTYVFGDPGMGKTSLRLALEASCRRKPDKTLVVSYVLSQNMENALSIEEHKQLLGNNLAIDLFIQILEQFKPGIDFPNDEQIQALGMLIWAGGRPLKRLIKQIITTPQPDNFLGLAEHWRMVGRLPIRYVSHSPELLDLLQQAQNSINTTQSQAKQWSSWEVGLNSAQQWHFEQIMLLVDGVDNWHHDPNKMMRLLEALLKETSAFSQQQIFFKYFLPYNLSKPIRAFLNNNAMEVDNGIVIDLIWDKQALRRLLMARLRAAGSRRVSLNDLASPNLTEEIDDWLLDQAQGSPRKLLQLMNALIDAHIQLSDKNMNALIEQNELDLAVRNVQLENR